NLEMPVPSPQRSAESPLSLEGTTGGATAPLSPPSRIDPSGAPLPRPQGKMPSHSRTIAEGETTDAPKPGDPCPDIAQPPAAPVNQSTAADPAPQSDSEAHPFRTDGGAVIRAGRVEARAGRKVKAVRPRLSLAAQADLAGLRRPRIVMKIATDTTGR